METKRTPGPWIMETYSVVASNTPVDGGDIICEAPLIFDDSMRRWQANARLIAAAPELLAALKKAYAFAVQQSRAPQDPADALTLEIIEAIVRAEGR